MFTAAKQDVWGVLRPKNTKGRTIEESVRNLPNELFGRAAKDWTDAWTMPHGEHVIAGCKKMPIMLVSRACDSDKLRRKHFLVAPVIAVSSLPEPQRTEDKLRDLRDNEIVHWFYLPQKQGLPESFADLTQIVHLHRSFFDEEILKTQLRARLSATGTMVLQSSLSDFYGTKFGFVPNKDSCPQTARYACSSCFYSGQPTPEARNFDEGQQFENCTVCGEAALWVKVAAAL